MKRSPNPAANETPAESRRGERGAALITTMMLTMLLLAAGGALIVTSSMAAATAADSTAEMQAYYAAEAGLEASLAVLRRNVASSPAGTAATFRTVVCGAANNGCVNNGGNLSQWLSYNSGRVTLDATNQLYYAVTVRDAGAAMGAALPNSPYSPRHLIVTSTGRGPKGAVKVLEMTVDSFSFDFTARATIAIRSHDTDTTPMTAFTLGSSNPHEWTGNDLAAQMPALPAFVVTNTADYDAGDGFGASTAQGRGEAAISSDNQNVSGQTLLEKLNPSSLESWLQNANQARAFITTMRAYAEQSGRLNPSDYGTTASPKFTFVDGNTGSEDGAGLLICTGNYVQGGSTRFNGIVLALGNGVVSRNGNPDTVGAVVVANFQHNWDATTQSYTGTGGFGSPTITTSGGGNSLVGYDSAWVRKAMESLGSRVLGVVEK